MTDSNEIYKITPKEESITKKGSDDGERPTEIYSSFEESTKKSSSTSTLLSFLQNKPVINFPQDPVVENSDNSTAFIRTILTSVDCPKNSVEVFKKLNQNPKVQCVENKCTLEESEILNNKNEPKILSKIKNEEPFEVFNSKLNINVEPFSRSEISFKPHPKKFIQLSDGYLDSSHSSSSELQSSTAPFESSSSSQENIVNSTKTDFDSAIPSDTVWRESPNITIPNTSIISEKISENLPSKTELVPTSSIPVITLDESNDASVEIIPTNVETTKSNTSQVPACVVGPVFPPPPPTILPINESESANADQPEVKIEETNGEIPVPTPVPIVPPTPRKRGRPRKQVLPNPSPLVESWGPNAQEFVGITPKEVKRSTRTKRKKFDGENDRQDGEGTPKRRYTKNPNKKRKKKQTYIPKKRGPHPKKKPTEMENIQNFEEETRMSASEGQGGFSSKTGVIGDESQSSYATGEGPTKTSINKKGRMEIMTDGCKPVTVQQIVEYCWPPQSCLPHGEKPEWLMIQEQISEYLGVKSFKRKYPSIKRRQVEMEERNYLQENGFVSENMCDMGLTAVYSADIIEIMYNDFPHKFDEYRKYTREKKAKEQRALREKQAAERADMDPLKEAIESAQSWNMEFNKLRREKRASCFDLQTFTVHFPANRFKRISLGKPGNYPVALIPGQNTDYYKKYTSNELKYFPLNTVVYGPLRPNERHFTLRGGSDGSQSEIDDSSSSDESSSSSSEETQDSEESNSTIDDEVNGENVKSEKEVEEKEVIVVKAVKETVKTPKGRGRGKIVVATPSVTSEPKKRLGRPPKLKLAAIKLKRVDGEDAVVHVKEEKPDATTRVIIHTCKMCHEEESKNKNGEFESFIECSQCKGKIHPTCIDLTTEMIPKISSYGWQCTDCKSCVECGQSSNEDKMIFCDQCDRGYHIFCVGLSEVPSGNYICIVCKPPTTNSQPDERVENKIEISNEDKEIIKEEKLIKDDDTNENEKQRKQETEEEEEKIKNEMGNEDEEEEEEDEREGGEEDVKNDVGIVREDGNDDDGEEEEREIRDGDDGEEEEEEEEEIVAERTTVENDEEEEVEEEEEEEEEEEGEEEMTTEGVTEEANKMEIKTEQEAENSDEKMIVFKKKKDEES